MGVKGNGPLSGEDILAALADARATGAPGLTMRQLADSTQRERKLVARIVDDLTLIGFVESDGETRTVRLGWRLRALAAQVADQRLVARGQSIVDHLAIDTRESSYLVIRRGNQSVTLAEAMPDLGVQGVSWLGRSQPVVRGDAGPVLLMDLDDSEFTRVVGSGPLAHSAARKAPRTLSGIERLVAQARKTGFIVLDGQVEDDVASIGAPVFDFRRRLVAAVVIVGPSPRVNDRLERNVEFVVNAAARLSRALGGRPWPEDMLDSGDAS